MEFCTRCNQPWHKGKNCEEAMDIEFHNYIKINEIQSCPKC